MDRVFNDPFYKNLRRNLRKNSTSAEIILWKQLKNRQILGFKFHRQYSIINYIADFYCPQLKLVIELDGGYHEELETMLSDEYRTNQLKILNIKLIRFKNEEVLIDIFLVIKKIEDVIRSLSKQPLY